MFLIFNPLLGEHFFRWGWNHQLVMDYSISHEMFGSFYLNQSGWLTEYHSKRSKLQCPHHFHMCWGRSNSQCLHREWPSTQIVGFIYPIIGFVYPPCRPPQLYGVEDSKPSAQKNSRKLEGRRNHPGGWVEIGWIGRKMSCQAGAFSHLDSFTWWFVYFLPW